MALERNEAEIALNGGVDTKSSEDIASPSTMKSVVDLRLNSVGEYEKRATWDLTSRESVNKPSGSVYDAAISGRPAASTVLKRGSQVVVLSENHGLMRRVDRYSTGPSATSKLEPATQRLSVGSSLNDVERYAPISCSVRRRFVGRTHDGKDSQFIGSCTSAEYGTVTVAAWIESNAGLMSLVLRAFDTETGVAVADEEVTTLASSIASQTVQSCTYSEAGYEGVVISYSDGNVSALPITIRAVRWDAATNAFIFFSNMTTTAAHTRHSLVSSGTTGFMFAYSDNASGFMEVELRNVSAGLLSSHTATHDCLGGVALLANTSPMFIASCTGGSGGNMYTELYGSPGAALAEGVLGAGESYVSVHVCEDSDTNSAVVLTSVLDSGFTGQAGIWARWRGYTYTSGAATAVGVRADLPGCFGVGAATVAERAYIALYPVAKDQPGLSSIIIARTAYDQGGVFSMTNPVARIGHDRSVISDYVLTTQSISLRAIGDKLRATFTADLSKDAIFNSPYRVQRPQTVFWSEVDFAGRPAPWCEAQGTTLFGGGMLHAYDGEQTTEHQPLSKPVVEAVDGGAGAQTGTVGFAAIWTFTDAAGNLHRSAPGFDSITVSAKDIDVYVTRPAFTAFDGLKAIEHAVELYATAVGGSVYYLVNEAAGNVDYHNLTLTSTYQWTTVLPGVVGDPVLYSNGTSSAERTSNPTPACHGLATISDRVWLLDSEDRTRVWPSKPLVTGYAPEFDVRDSVFIGDESVGLSDVGGVPTVFGRAGIWQIYGEGPNALGAGGFAPARRLPHEVECMDPLSVCKTPIGVFFRGRRGVYLLTTGLDLEPVGVTIDHDLRVSGRPDGYCRIVYDELSNEVHVMDYVKHFVLNLTEMKWTEMSRSASVQDWIDAVVVDGSVWSLHKNSNQAQVRRQYALDETGRNADTRTWSLETPKLRFDGVTGRVRVWEIVLVVRLGDAPANAGILTAVVADDSGTTDTFTWSAADLAAQGGADERVPLRMQLSNQQMRSFSLSLSEAAPSGDYTGTMPIAARVLYGVTPGGKRNLPSAARKGSST